MLNRFRSFRERGWQEIDAATYAEAWALHGGSVITHPDVVARLSGLAGLPVRYLGWIQEGRVDAALAAWDHYLALSRDALKHFGRKRLFDLGNAEYILPAAPDVHAPLRHHARYLSETHARQFAGISRQRETLMMSRPPEDLSRKFRYNQRREWRLLQDAGATARPVQEYPADSLARIYGELFKRKWGFAAPGLEHLSEVFALLQGFMVGFVIEQRGDPVAVQVIYKTVAPRWVSVEYVNGGVAPEAEKFSPGSVLSYLNTEAAWEEARLAEKELRYSFGRADREYKERWCRPVTVYCR
ncbi:MAG: antimicrobial resistance protein Mig-14 [Desulfuromonadales bacterium]|nr:antimicrobial resistance protein Mig-14 [Desulfuromonadales bacterium]